MKIVLLAFLILLPCSAHSESWLNLGGVSYHLNREKTFNESNYGLGVRFDINEFSSVSVGAYRNSQYNMSRYGIYSIDLISKGIFSAGFIVGAINGYTLNDGGLVPVALPCASVSGKNIAADLSFVPQIEKRISSVFNLSIRFRISI